MSVKKIEGFTIFLKERLGEGSFGAVRTSLLRFTRQKRTTLRNPLLLKSSIKRK